MVETESRANYRLPPAENRRRPRDRDARIDIERVGVAETGSHAAEARRPASGKVKWIGLAVCLVKNVVKAVPYAQVKREAAAGLPFVLRIGVHLRFAQAVHRQLIVECGGADRVHQKTGRRAVQ